ncbi:hypothetical protein Dimus_000039 [Dionaea muscipula]
MGSSDSGGGGAGLVDTGVGSIVWVRRRNGSWWPGKILGPDELSASHLMSPRSGTPVKLLGREDASVDWYNLEKSKRVKPFRCGDFDDCIEKAEASLGMPAKKREKYARREDAILHALELEKQLLDQKYVNLGTASYSRYLNSSDSGTKDLATSSGTLDGGNGSLGNHEFREGHRKFESSIENDCSSIPVSLHRGDEHMNLEYDSSEVNPRRSGLLDYRHRKASTKHMSSPFPGSNGAHKAIVDLHALVFSDEGPFLGRHNDADGTEFINRKKRVLEVSLEESIAKRRDKRRPLPQVLESSAKLPGHSLRPDSDILSLTGGEHTGHDSHAKKSRTIYLPTDFNHLVDINGVPHDHLIVTVPKPGESNPHPRSSAFAGELSSGSSEETESDSSGTDSMEGDIHPALTTFSDTARVNARILSQNRLAFQGQHESTSSEEHDVSSPDDPSQYRFHDPVSPSVEVSRWQLKGKRNVRQPPRRPVDSFSHGMYLEGIRRSLTQRMQGPSLSYYHDADGFTNDVEDLIENDIGTREEEELGNRRYLPGSRRQSIPRQRLIDWEDLALGDRSFKGCLDGRGGGFYNVGRPGHDMLIDVDLKVQAKQTRGEHVPWVSLMSKLNGQAIIGHPIQIETLEDGATDILLSAGDEASGSFGYNNGNRAAPTVWRTARRTANVRVPRPHLSALLDDDEAGNHYFDQDRTSQFKKPAAAGGGGGGGGGGGFTNKKNQHPVKKTTLSHVPKPPQQRIKKQQQHKKTSFSASASQKTRTLSSMGINQKNGDNYYLDGVIKNLSSEPPTVACIPVKLVFSRLLEAVGRPPTHGVSVNNNKERNPS